MQAGDKYSIALYEAMDDELKIRLSRIADIACKPIGEVVLSFLSEGVSTYPGFLASYTRD